MPPLAIIGGISAAGSIGSAAIGASAAGHAADTQAQAAMQAAQLQHQDAQAALGFQQQQYQNSQTQFAPWLQAGTGALANLAYQTGIPGFSPTTQGSTLTAAPQNKVVTKPSGSLGTLSLAGSGFPGRMTPGGGPMLQGSRATPLAAGGANQFGLTTGTLKPGYTPPSNLGSLVNPQLGGFGSLMQPFNGQVTEQNDPGYKFRLDQGMQALQRSAAAKGDLLSGGTAKALTQYGQDYASNEYQNTYNRFMNNQATRYNRLASLAGVGQQAAGQIGQLGQSAAGNAGNILMESGQQIGNQFMNAGNARASGYANAANAWGGAISSGTNTLADLLLLQQMGKI